MVARHSIRQRGCISIEEAERWLITQLAAEREVGMHGARESRDRVSQAAACGPLASPSSGSIAASAVRDSEQGRRQRDASISHPD